MFCIPIHFVNIAYLQSPLAFCFVLLYDLKSLYLPHHLQIAPNSLFIIISDMQSVS